MQALPNQEGSDAESTDKAKEAAIAWPLNGPLSASYVDAIVRAAETALEVRRRYQFFVWSQSNLLALLPHHLAVCGAYSRPQRELRFEVFNSVSVAPLLLDGLTDGRGVLVQQLQGRWIERRCRPVLVPVESLAGQSIDPLRAALLQAGYAELLVHGVSRPQRPSEIESFFIFANVARRAGPPQLAMLELLMPHLHSTWLRVQAVEQEINDPPTRALPSRSPGSGGITARERQILSWLREGLSNQQIGEVLGISALTVKNHVQKILRKLNAANRAQAVARAMALNLLGSGSPADGGGD